MAHTSRPGCPTSNPAPLRPDSGLGGQLSFMVRGMLAISASDSAQTSALTLVFTSWITLVQQPFSSAVCARDPTMGQLGQILRGCLGGVPVD
jgi:hypothetical protein